MTREISITRALVELKTLDRKIERKIDDGIFISYYVGEHPVSGFEDNDKAIAAITAEFQSVTALINGRDDIKSAIVKSNAVTKVTIANKEMTVAQAIERKSEIKFHKAFLIKLKDRHASITHAIERRTHDIEEVVNGMAERIAGKQSKLKDTDIETLKKIATDKNKPILVDPSDLRTKIDSLEEQIEGFERDVDIVLSESNTRSKITLTD